MKDQLEEIKRKLAEAELRIGKHMRSEPKTVKVEGNFVKQQTEMFLKLRALLEIENKNLQKELMDLEDKLQKHKKGGSSA
jgi:hypothetical protein